MKHESSLSTLLTCIFLAVVVGFFSACGGGGEQPEALVEESAATSSITVSPNVPSDITGGAPSADLSTASDFAWQEFIALTWPAVDQTGANNTRGVADSSANYGETDVPLVWETYRNKVEIFGPGAPHGYVDDSSQSYGFDALPQYDYTQVTPGPCSGTPSSTTPFVNLDENSEIGLDKMLAGVGPTSPAPGQEILFAAKANRTEYVYVASNQFWSQASNTTTAKNNTVTFIQDNKSSPPAGSSEYVSFASGTIEIKTAWRRLNSSEDASRFRTTTVRYYETDASDNPCYVDATFGMLALHIIQKTPTAPCFIFATFEQADNLLTNDGSPVEDVDGNLIANQTADPYDPNITSQNATATTDQVLSPSSANCTPGSRLYYQNTPGQPTPQPQVCVNKRKHDIPQDVISANAAAHSAISSYNSDNNVTGSPWGYYKLVNVQWVPVNKPTPGVDYSGPNTASYYLANSVVETDYNLAVFSGRFADTFGLITDFTDSGDPFFNTFFSGTANNMGGCMGCHGNAQVGGTDFSFIFNSETKEPDTAGSATGPGTESFARFERLVSAGQTGSGGGDN